MSTRPKSKTTRNRSHSRVNQKGRRVITLRGFYITPFGVKNTIGKGRDAVKDVQTNIDFERVARIVTAAITKSVQRTSRYTYRFTLERHTIKAAHLDASIQANIDQADYIVADWTGMNPNVLLEAGYAEGRAKHGIHLTADEVFPSDRAGIIYVPYDPNNLADLVANLPHHLGQLVQRIEKGPWVFDYYALRATALVARMIQDTKEHIDMLQTNLDTVNANHIPDLKNALRRGVSVRILTLDPQSRYVNERALQLGYKEHQIKIYRDGLQTAIDNTAAHLTQLPGFRLRLYNDFPNQLTYIFDDRVLASVMSRTGRSRDNCVFLLPRHRLPGAKHTFIDHFNQLWKSAGQESASAIDAAADRPDSEML